MRSIGATTSTSPYALCLLIVPDSAGAAFTLPSGGAAAGGVREQNTLATIEEKARHADETIWAMCERLKKVKVDHLGGRLSSKATNMEFSGDLPPNRNLVKTRAFPYFERSALEAAGLSEAEKKRAGLVLEDRAANEDLVNYRLNNRDDLVKMPSAWSPDGANWWKQVAVNKVKNNCLAVQFMELYRQAVNYHYQNLGDRAGKAVDFDQIWQRMVMHKQHKTETINDIISLTGVPFPIFRPHGHRAEQLNKYLAKPPLMDWIRHPALLAQQLAEASATLTKPKRDWKRLGLRRLPAATVAGAEQYSEKFIAMFEQEAVYYNLFSWRFTHLRGAAFDFFSEAELVDAMDLGPNFKTLPVLDHRHGRGVTDLSICKASDIQPTELAAVEKYLKHLRVEQTVFALLNRNVFGDATGRNAVVPQIFDSQKCAALKAAQSVVKEWYQKALPADSPPLVTFALRWSVTRAMHKWFESIYVPAVSRAEPALDTVSLPLKEVTPGDRSVACIVDMMHRMDTNELAATIAKYYCNEPNPVVKPGGKQQSSRIKYREGPPIGPHTLIRPANVASTIDAAFDHFNEAPGFHVAFHIKEQDQSSRVVLPGFQEMYTRYDEVLTGKNQRAFYGHTAHFGVDKTASDEAAVFSFYTLTPKLIDSIKQTAVSLVHGLKHGSMGNSRTDFDPQDDEVDAAADDEELASKEVQSSFRRHPLLKELESISKLTDPYIDRGLVSKGIYEILGHGFTLIAPPAHMKVIRKKPSAKKSDAH